MQSKINTLQEVIQEIQKYENKHGEKLRFYENLWQKIPFWIAIGSFLLALLVAVIFKWINWKLFYQFDLRLTAYLLLFISLIAVAAYELLVFIPIIPSILKPTSTYLDKIYNASKNEDELIKVLSHAEIAALDQAMERFDYEVKSLESRIDAITGAIQKIGILPSAIALYIAYSKKEINQTNLFYQHIDYILYFVFGIYLGSLLTRNVIDKFKLFTILIKNAKERAGFRQRIGYPQS